MLFGINKKLQMPTIENALPGRQTSMPIENCHFVNGHPIAPPFPKGMEQALDGSLVSVIWDLVTGTFWILSPFSFTTFCIVVTGNILNTWFI